MYKLSITYDTNRRGLTAYDVSIERAEPGEQPKFFAQRGDCWNNSTISSGVFSKLQEAVNCALDYIDVPCVIFGAKNAISGREDYFLRSQRDRLDFDPEYVNVRVLGASNERGAYLAK